MDADLALGWTAGRMAFAAGRLFGSRREVGRVAFQVDSCSCKSEVVVKGDIGRKGWRVDIAAVAVGRRLPVVLEEVASVVAGRSQDCMVEEGHRRVDMEACFAVAEQAVVVVCFAAARAQAWVA